jgi:uncharacterized protein YmfQ (DUF2313 family)
MKADTEAAAQAKSTVGDCVEREADRVEREAAPMEEEEVTSDEDEAMGVEPQSGAAAQHRRQKGPALQA